MTTNADIATHLFTNTRNVRELRAQGVLPPAGGSVDACREAYIRHLQEAAAGRLPDAQQRLINAERLRLVRGQADEVASRNAERRGRLVSLPEISAAVIGMIQVAKMRLGLVPGKVAPSDPALKARIAAAIDDALHDLAATRALPDPQLSPASDSGDHRGDGEEAEDDAG